jgi:hypothetical protein
VPLLQSEEGLSERRPVVRRITVLVLLVVGPFPFLSQAVADESSEKLTEHALDSAKRANIMLSEIEQGWCKVAEGLIKDRAVLTMDGSGSTRNQASRQLGSAKKVVSDYKRLVSDLKQYEDALKEVASRYREMAAIYKVQASETRSEEIKEGYVQLSTVYERKAQSAIERAKRLTLPAESKSIVSLVEEGNLFFERFVEALSIDPMDERDRMLFTGRLKKHGERSQALAEQVLAAIDRFLEGSGTANVRHAFDEHRTVGSVPPFLNKPPSNRHSAGGPKALTSDVGIDFFSDQPPSPRLLLEGSWTCQRTIRNIECLQIISINRDGTCSHSLDIPGVKEPIRPRPQDKWTLKLDPVVHCLCFYWGGRLMERGRFMFHGPDVWTYEVFESYIDSNAANTTLTFTRVKQKEKFRP